MDGEKWCAWLRQLPPGREVRTKEAASRDGLTQYCKPHANAYRKRGRATVNDKARAPAEGGAIIVRECRRDLECLGGPDGIRAIEQRLALARSLKRAACGRPPAAYHARPREQDDRTLNPGVLAAAHGVDRFGLVRRRGLLSSSGSIITLNSSTAFDARPPAGGRSAPAASNRRVPQQRPSAGRVRPR